MIDRVRRLPVPLALCGVLFVCVTTSHAHAAEEKQQRPAAAQTADDPKEDDATILGWIDKSGWSGYLFMIALGLFSVMAVAVTIERLVNLRREKLLPAEFVRQFRTVVQNGDRDPAAFRTVCEQFIAPAAMMLKAGVLRAGRPLPEVEKAMEDAAVRESSAIRARTRPLSVIASVAPLVGLLGTVVGMILAFHTTSQAPTGSNKAELLAEGIYLALLTTAAGLTIAIPAMLFAAYFNARLERFLREIDELLMDAMPAFAAMEQQDGIQMLTTPTPLQPKSPKLAAIQNA